MTWQRICRIFIFSVVILVLLFDLFLAIMGGHDATVSIQGYVLSGGNLIGFRERTLLIAFGYIAGHVFGRLDR